MNSSCNDAIIQAYCHKKHLTRKKPPQDISILFDCHRIVLAELPYEDSWPVSLDAHAIDRPTQLPNFTNRFP